METTAFMSACNTRTKAQDFAHMIETAILIFFLNPLQMLQSQPCFMMQLHFNFTQYWLLERGIVAEM